MKKLIPLFFVLILVLSLAACGLSSSNTPGSNDTSTPPANEATPTIDNSTPDETPSGGNNGSSDPKSPEAAFRQFGLDVNQVKPNLAEPAETTIQYGNEVSDTLYFRKAAYTEKSDTDIDAEAGKAYNQRMFEYCKSVSADGKVYYNYTNASGEPQELTSVDGLIDETVLINLISWSYKVDGMWVDVYMEWSMTGDEIGITMNGSGSY